VQLSVKRLSREVHYQQSYIDEATIMQSTIIAEVSIAEGIISVA